LAIFSIETIDILSDLFRAIFEILLRLLLASTLSEIRVFFELALLPLTLPLSKDRSVSPVTPSPIFLQLLTFDFGVFNGRLDISCIGEL